MTDEDHMADSDPMADPDQCTATASSTGERCKQPAIKGSNVCRFHGGRAPQVEEKAKERLERLANETLAQFEPRLDDLFEQYDNAKTVQERVNTHREIRQSVTDILDRADHGPTETHEHTGEDGDPLTVVSQVVEVTEDE